MMRTTLLAMALGLIAFSGCKKKEKTAPPPAPNIGVAGDNAKRAPGPSMRAEPGTPVVAGDSRRIAVVVNDTGFEPSKIDAKAGEQLTLVFTRTTTSACGAEVMLKATGEKKELPLNQPVELAVLADKPGEIAFACGMDMMQGTIVVQ